ncbi:hypothetical protein HZS_2780 [Henneguya salminicola]|nr:hypothetical protein HZS_2780 [Henneguya salminicola]
MGPPATFKWVLRARCDLLPTKSSLQRRKILSTSEEGLSCRLCGEEKESLPHILNKCVVSKALQTVRHDAIQNLLVKCLPKNEKTMIRVNKQYPFDSQLRPDILIMQNGRNEDYILDVQISFDSVKSVERAKAEKIRKYSSLIVIHLKKNTNRTLYIIHLTQPVYLKETSNKTAYTFFD